MIYSTFGRIFKFLQAEYTAFLRSDGSVVTFGGNDIEQCDILSCAMLGLQKELIIFFVF